MAINRTSPKKGKVVDIPTAPTVGTATAGAESATVEYTAATKGGPATTFTALSSPGSFTGTGTSPITVTGLTAGTAYTFTVRGSNATGNGEYSVASNSITALVDPTSFESIATITVASGGASNVTFSSIPSTYKHLQLRLFGLPNGSNNLTLRLNGDTGSNYSTHFIQGNGASVSATDDFNVTNMYLLGLYTDSSSYGGVSVVDVLDYQNTNKYKTIRALSGQDGNATGTATNWRVTFGSGLWRSTSAVNELNITAPAWRQYTHAALYGIKG